MILLVLFSVLEVTSGATSALAVREKRQQAIYVCGTYPNTFYSYFPCDYWNQPSNPSNPNTCANGGRKIGVGCYFNYQCTPYSSQQTVCLNNCCCTVPILTTRPPFVPTTTTRSVANLAYCYNGQRTQVRCTTSVDCAAGQTCINAICCTTTGNEYTGACGGLPALAACSTGRVCGTFQCTTSNYCCECQYGRTAGLCNNGACQTGYTCNNPTSGSGYCCPTCANGRAPFGACFNGLCANGYTCQTGNICC